MKVLVTGAAGFIGSQVVRHLLSRGDEVIALVRPGSSTSRIRGLARIEELDLENQEGLDCLLALEKPLAVMHLAWYANPVDYLMSFRNLVSLRLSVQLAEKAFASGCLKLVGVGTCLEYAPSDRPHREGDPADPQSLYASAKHAAWLMARALAERAGAELAWARVFHLFGPGEDETRLVPSVRAALAAGKPIDLTAGEQVRDYLHVADVASALVALLEPGVRGLVNVCSGEARPLRESLGILGRLSGRPELLRFGKRPYAADERMHLAGCGDRLRGLGWRPRFPTLEAALLALEPHCAS